MPLKLPVCGTYVARDLGSIGMTTPDSPIVLHGAQGGLAYDPIVDHPGQPADYTHTDGTVWTWTRRWRIVGAKFSVLPEQRVLGTHLRVYDLMVPDTDPNCRTEPRSIPAAVPSALCGTVIPRL